MQDPEDSTKTQEQEPVATGTLSSECCHLFEDPSAEALKSGLCYHLGTILFGLLLRGRA